jgi:hypothetical protein
MIHYEDPNTLIEITGRTVAILPRPALDRDRATALRAMFPERNGWTHYPYGLHMVVEDEKTRTRLADAAAAELVKNGRPA